MKVPLSGRTVLKELTDKECMEMMTPAEWSWKVRLFRTLLRICIHRLFFQAVQPLAQHFYPGDYPGAGSFLAALKAAWDQPEMPKSCIQGNRECDGGPGHLENVKMHLKRALEAVDRSGDLIDAYRDLT